jgi:hypothetical protein
MKHEKTAELHVIGSNIERVGDSTTHSMARKNTTNTIAVVGTLVTQLSRNVSFKFVGYFCPQIF